MTYLYSCECGLEYEIEQRITEPALELCPHCSKHKPKRLISCAPTFCLKEGKAGGWSNSSYGHTPQQLNAMRKLGRPLTRRV